MRVIRVSNATLLGVYKYSGHRQLSKYGQEEVIRIGTRGNRKEFGDLTQKTWPLYDHSSSMDDDDMLN
jgi:hypothetical protein